MNLAASNIAWTHDQRHEAYGLLRRHGFTGLEIAPGILFADADDPFDPSPAIFDTAVGELRDAGLTLVSMQSLLFGVSGAALFGSDLERATLVAGMRRAIALAGLCGIENLVFGSPRQRVVPEGLSLAEANALAADVFRTLGNDALDAGARIAMEFNPAAYGTNYLNTFDEALAFVEQVAHPGVQLCLDVGALHMNNDFERVAQIVPRCASLISHVHISEPHLAPAPASEAQAGEVLRALQASFYARWVSIEMKATGDLKALDDSLARLARAAIEVVPS